MFFWSGWSQRTKILVVVTPFVIGLLSLFAAVGIIGVKASLKRAMENRNQNVPVSQPNSTSPTQQSAFGQLSSGNQNTPISQAASIPAEYQIDTNGDGIPDFVEKGTKYDWQKDECLAKLGDCAQPVLKEGRPKPKNMIVILDASGSMGEVVNGVVKMTAGKEALKKFIDSVPTDVNLSLIVFGHKGNNSATQKSISCAGVETLYPLSPPDKPSLISAIDSFQPRGWTPLAAALNLAGQTLNGHENEDNSIVLLTDGQETCGGNPVASAQSLRLVDVKTIIDVMGFSVTAAEKSQLQQIAQAGGGEYNDVSTQSDIDELFRKHSNTMQVVFYQTCETAHTNDYGVCSLWRHSAAQDYLLYTLEKQSSSGPQYEILNAVLHKMADDVSKVDKTIYDRLKSIEKANPVPSQ